MLKIFAPNMYRTSVGDINLKTLKEKGFRYIFIDLDNTVVPWGENYFAEGRKEWILNAVSEGFKICIVSNSSSGRCAALAGQVDLPFVCPAFKPLKRGFLKALELTGGKSSQAVMIGDQIFTDVLGANLCGFYSVMVNPIHSRELFTTRLMRRLEKFFINLLKIKGLFPA